MMLDVCISSESQHFSGFLPIFLEVKSKTNSVASLCSLELAHILLVVRCWGAVQRGRLGVADIICQGLSNWRGSRPSFLFVHLRSSLPMLSPGLAHIHRLLNTHLKKMRRCRGRIVESTIEWWLSPKSCSPLCRLCPFFGLVFFRSIFFTITLS